MSRIEHDSIYKSGSDGDGEAVLPTIFSRPPPGFTPSRSPDIGEELSSFRPNIAIFPDQYGNNSDDENVEEMGLDLGRRLAWLELGNKLNKDQIEKIEKQCEIKDETLAGENARVNDLKGKLISMEARLSSEEKQGFDVKEKVERLEKMLKMKDQECLELKKSLANEVAERAKQSDRFSKIEQGNCQLTSQFITLLETCEKFNEELQQLKKMNAELKKELKKKEMAELNDLPSAPLPSSSCHGSKLSLNPTNMKISANDVSNPFKSDYQKVTRPPPTVKVSNSLVDIHSKTKIKINSIIPKSQPQGYYAQEFIPQNYPNYCYSGLSGSTAFYYPPAPPPTLMFYAPSGPTNHGVGVPQMKNANFNGYQDQE